MKVEVPFHYGQSVYIKNDPEQIEYLIDEIILCPGKVIHLNVIDAAGAVLRISEFLINTERDIIKKTS